MNTAAQPPSRLNAVFARLAAAAPAPRTALIPYVTAGYPSPQATPKLMHALVAAGADIIELGVPFSDPMADGPVIQQASEYAIAQGVGLPQVLQMVEDFRREDSSTPVVLMGYANPIERMGQTGFVACAQQAGVDGILTVDYPPEEITEFAALLDAANIAPIFLLAPTSSDARIRQVAQAARGYVYYVSLKGVTGAGHLDIENVIERVNHIRQHVRVPVGVGFGIRDAASAVSLARAADAVIIGSKLLQVMGQAMAQAGIDSPDVSQTQVDQAAIHAARQWLAGISQALKTNA